MRHTISEDGKVSARREVVGDEPVKCKGTRAVWALHGSSVKSLDIFCGHGVVTNRF